MKAHPGWVFSRAFFSPDSEIRFVEFLKKVHGDAILLILPFFRLGQQEIAEILGLPTPMIFLATIFCAKASRRSILSRRRPAAAAECLLRNGHRRIALILSEPQSVGSWRRNDAFLAYLRLHGVSPRIIDCEVRSGEASCAKTHDRMTAYLRRYGADFSGCFATSDYSAFGVVSACRECGYGVPEEISVIGAGNIASAACFFPPLTTIAGRSAGQRPRHPRGP